MTRPGPEIESPVFRRLSQVGPQVQQPSSTWTLVLGVALAVVLGAMVFNSLNASRQARADKARASQAAAAAPKLTPVSAPIMPPAPSPAPPPLVVAQAAPAPIPSPVPASDPSLRLHAPVMVVDQSEARAAQAAAAPAGSAGSDHGADTGGSAEERFASHVASGGVETSRATQLGDLTRVVPQGTVIPAVLETAINSDLPGSVRAVVSRDVRGFNGAQVLIPRGSKLIGQYRSGMAYGQTRAFVVWARILTPDGVSIDVGSPGTDPLGRGGLAGETDTHFFQRFGGAILLSVLSAGLEAAADSAGGGTSVIIGSPIQAGALASQAPQKTDIPVTIKVMQGTPLQVFLVRDLDFSGVAAARR